MRSRAPLALALVAVAGCRSERTRIAPGGGHEWTGPVGDPTAGQREPPPSPPPANVPLLRPALGGDDRWQVPFSGRPGSFGPPIVGLGLRRAERLPQEPPAGPLPTPPGNPFPRAGEANAPGFALPGRQTPEEQRWSPGEEAPSNSLPAGPSPASPPGAPK